MKKTVVKQASLKSLAGTALQDWESEMSWEAIRALQMLGSPETLAMAQRFATSKNRHKRALAMYIASQLRRERYPKRWHSGSHEYAMEETQALLLAGLNDPIANVVLAAISGVGHRPHPSALPALLAFATHADANIRFQVAFALAHYHEDASVEALLALAADPDDDTRDWATFALGSMHEADTAEIRERLWHNLGDSNESVSGEALAGLASRKDERVIAVLLERLDDDCMVFELDAAEMMASPLLLAPLNAIRNAVSRDEDSDSYWHNRLDAAIAACGGGEK
ncbi:HEAT repeat domain-containing protein [Massilia frigida]|nr:HEAT repeat domain-containing protein [Massilia frigida]